MELTQIQGQNPGQRVPVMGQPVNIGSDPSSQIVHPGLVQNAAQVTVSPDGQKVVRPMMKSSPVVVNGQRVGGPTPINYGDSIAVGKNNDVVLGVNKPGEKLDMNTAQKHLSNLNFTPEQIQEITKRLFDVNNNRIIKIPLFSFLGIIVLLLAGVIYLFVKFSNLNGEILKNSSDLDKKISTINSSISSIQNILGVDPSSSTSCEPGDENCAGTKNIETKINELNSKVGSFTTKVSEAEKSFVKLRQEFDTINSSIKGDGLKIIQDNVTKSLNEGAIKNIQDQMKKVKDDFDKLDSALGNIVTGIKEDIKGFTKYSDDFKNLKDTTDFMTKGKVEFDKKITGYGVDIEKIQKNIDTIDRRYDILSTDLNVIKESIGKLEQKVNALSK